MTVVMMSKKWEDNRDKVKRSMKRGMWSPREHRGGKKNAHNAQHQKNKQRN